MVCFALLSIFRLLTLDYQTETSERMLPLTVATACVLIVMGSYGLLINLLYLSIFFHSKELRTNSFFILSVSVSMADLIGICVCTFYCAPSLLLGTNLTNLAVNIFLSVLMCMMFWCSMVTFVIQSFNRYVAIKWPTQVAIVFAPDRMKFILLTPYFLGFLMGLPLYFDCCTAWFEPIYVTILYKAEWYYYIDMSFTCTCLFMTFTLHFLVIFKLLKRNKEINPLNQTHRSGIEVSQFIQLFVVTLCPLIFEIIQFIEVFHPIEDIEAAGLLNMFILMMVTCANGTVNVFVNTAVKREIRGQLLEKILPKTHDPASHNTATHS